MPSRVWLGAAAGDSAPSALAMLDAHQEKALGMLDITGQDVPYCMGALELNGWDRQRAINWHLAARAGRCTGRVLEGDRSTGP